MRHQVRADLTALFPVPQKEVSVRDTQRTPTTRERACLCTLSHLTQGFTQSFVRLSRHSTARASTERVESHDAALAQLSLSKQVVSTRPALFPSCSAPCWRSRFVVGLVSALRVPLALHACPSSVSCLTGTCRGGIASLGPLRGRWRCGTSCSLSHLSGLYVLRFIFVFFFEFFLDFHTVFASIFTV